MKANRFLTLIEAYGADPARWPEAERAAALAFAEQATGEAKAALEAARVLDAELAQHTAPLPDAVAFARALKAAEVATTAAPARGFRWPSFGWDRFKLASSAGLMAAACAGVVFGAALTDRLTADVQADAVLYQSSLSALDDVEVLG